MSGATDHDDTMISVRAARDGVEAVQQLDLFLGDAALVLAERLRAERLPERRDHRLLQLRTRDRCGVVAVVRPLARADGAQAYTGILFRPRDVAIIGSPQRSPPCRRDERAGVDRPVVWIACDCGACMAVERTRMPLGTDLDARGRRLQAALEFLGLPPTEPELGLLHRWLDTWAGMSLITAGMTQQGWDHGLATLTVT